MSQHSPANSQVIQRGRDKSMNLEIFHTGNRGWGVRTKSDIKTGQFIGVYAGEIVSESESEKRGELYDRVGRTYIFDMDGYHIGNLPPRIDELRSMDPRGYELAKNEAKRVKTIIGEGENNGSTFSGESSPVCLSVYAKHPSSRCFPLRGTWTGRTQTNGAHLVFCLSNTQNVSCDGLRRKMLTIQVHSIY